VARDFVAPIRARYDAPKPAAAARPKPRLDEDEAAEVRRVRRMMDDERRTRAAQTAANAKADFKNYTNAYVVFEHPFHKCHKYPKSDKMEFFDIVLECNGQRVVDPKWTTGGVKRVCDFEAHVVNASRIKFTWDHDKPEVHP
jgi:hypothetical protein